MIRNLKALGLALVAVFAMSALAASAAHAVTTDGEFTSDGAVTVTGSGVEKLTFEAGQTLTCNGDHTVMPVNQTPWAAFNPGAGLTTLTDQSHYSSCTASVGAQTLPATVTTNGCDFVIHIGETKVANVSYSGTADVVCGAGESIEIHVYQQASHATSVCTYKVGPQTGLSGATAENITEEVEVEKEKFIVKKIKVSGEVTGITASRTGVLCGGTKHTSAAIQHANTTLGGTNEAGKPKDISVTH